MKEPRSTTETTTKAFAATLVSVACHAGCGGKTDLEVPPIPPCEIDAAVRGPALPCDSLTLGEPVALSRPVSELAFDFPFVFVWSIDAAAHAGGAVVAFQIHDDREPVTAIRTIALDAEGRPRGHAEVLVSHRASVGVSLVQPSVATWGCGYAVLGGLWTSRHDEGSCALSIARDGATPLTVDGASWDCHDLLYEGDGLSWQATTDAGIRSFERATLSGERSRVPLIFGALSGLSEVTAGLRRVPLPDGVALLPMPRASDPGAVLVRFHRGSGVAERLPLTERILVDVGGSAVDEVGATWLVWTESDDPDAPATGLRAARVDAEGLAGPVVAMDTGGLSAVRTHARPLWLGERLLVPLRDEEEMTSVAVFAPSGERVALAPIAKAHTITLVAVPGGALALYAEVHEVETGSGPIPTTLGSVLMALPLRCGG